MVVFGIFTAAIGDICEAVGVEGVFEGVLASTEETLRKRSFGLCEAGGFTWGGSVGVRRLVHVNNLLANLVIQVNAGVG